MRLANFPRRKYFVDGLQYRMLVMNSLYLVAIVLVLAGTLFIPLIMKLNSGGVLSPSVQDAAREVLGIHTRLWPPVVLLVLLFIVHNFLTSHRIAGPLYRIRDELRKIGDGNLFVHVRLRKGDYLTKEADAVNQLVEALRTKIRRIEQKQRDVRGLLVELQRAVIRGSADEINEQIEELTAVVDRLKESVEQFQLPREKSRPPENAMRDGEAKSLADPVGAKTEGEN